MALPGKNTDSPKPPTTKVEVYVEAYRVELTACGWCGAFIHDVDHHAAWHESLSETTQAARRADAATTLIG